MSTLPDKREKQSWLERPIFSFFPTLTGELFIFLAIILLAAVSRLYDLGARAMSHDETIHVYFSWLYSQGQGYQHSPLSHGPLLFHLTALTYFLFGASDFTARFPQALSSVLTIVLLWKWRRYLGKAGALVAAGLMLISPFMLYYGRYARNEAFVALFGVLTLYAILRYFETGKARYLVLLTIATALHFTSKETAFIYTAQAMLFLAACLVNRVIHSPWAQKPNLYKVFLFTISAGVILVAASLGLVFYNRTQAASDASQTASPLLPGQTPAASAAHLGPFSATTILFSLAILVFITAVVFLILGYGWSNLRRERSFAMLLILGTFVLPQLAAFPAAALGWDPLAYQFKWPGWDFQALFAQAPVKTGVVFLVLVILSVVVGVLWEPRRWFGYAAIFWGIYILFFTSLFTNWEGFFTGSVGSLGYWLVQQGVHRGSQPWYYYLLIQVPIYEFLPAAGLCLAVYFGLRRKSPALFSQPDRVPQGSPEIALSNDPPLIEAAHSPSPSFGDGNLTFQLLLWWSLSAILAFTIAGEKMPWLTVHIALPLILLTGWALGQAIERLDWVQFRARRGAVITILLAVFFIGLSSAAVLLFGAQPPFQGKTLSELAVTEKFLFAVVSSAASIIGLLILEKGWKLRDIYRLAAIVLFGLLAVLTVRTSYRAAFVNYDNALEYLVYAHGGSGITDVMAQIEKISSRISGGHNLEIAYDNNLPKQGLSWSFKWYFRNYPNAKSFDKPDETLKDVPVILVDVNNFQNIKQVVGDNYYQFDFIRMVWPNQDYFALTWPRLKYAITNPVMRSAIFQIWLNRDYSAYASATGKNGLSVTDWQPSDKMQLFIRKDIAAQIWDYGIYQAAALQSDPYENGTIDLQADLIAGLSDGLKSPRGIAAAADGSLFVADSLNHRILHLDQTGKVTQVIGKVSPGCPYAQVPPPDVPLDTFCEPWAVAASPDGKFFFVADTWNHRVLKFEMDGTPVKSWGTPNYDPVSSGPFGMWGPRGIAVDAKGRVFVADTGNKRILIYDTDGNFIFQIGAEGMSNGQFEEPVGLAFDLQNNLYVADTWNQRIQVFAPVENGNSYFFSNQWTIGGWNGESNDNKPYLAVDHQGHLFATDPEDFRVLEFTLSGQFIRTWGSYGAGMNNFGLASGVAVDSQGKIWVSDTANNRLLQFSLP
jgi:predicted membrane-bound mannosyltransferase/DNA-binding beta-propeller fold protein YncE